MATATTWTARDRRFLACSAAIDAWMNSASPSRAVTEAATSTPMLLAERAQAAQDAADAASL